MCNYSFGNTNTPGLNWALGNFQKRFGAGVCDNSLVGGEIANVKGSINEFRSDLARAKADGVVTREERQELWGEAREINRDIYQSRHNKVGNQLPPGGSPTPGLDYWSGNFGQRVRAGSRDGSLTCWESGMASQAVCEYRQDLAEAKSDGFVTPWERRELRGEAGYVNQLIFNLRHNAFGTMGPLPGMC